ncbi:MAG: ATP-binding protein [Coriobacteriales bacterium]|nr:ATP-binding protein [Coriobacteriales bacterium]
MNHELIKRVIYDQQDVIARSHIVPRDYLLEDEANYVLTGLRRSGKSTMLYAIAQRLVATGTSWDAITYVNFEDERLAEFSISDFDDIVAVQSEMCGGHGYFFFDEIQNIDGWERFARRLADSNERVYITGSNAKMLSREIGGVLGGRYMSKEICTYSFLEYLDATGTPHGEREILSTRANGLIRSRFDELYRFGGFPECITYTNKREYVSSVYQKVLLGDVIARNEIRNVNALRLLVKKVAESVRNDISYSKLCNVLRSTGVSISKDTVIDYVSFLEDSYLLFSIGNYFSKFASRESTPKYYFSDNGLLNLFLFRKETALLENVVATHLRRKHPNDLFFLKSSKAGVDVDFFVPEERMAIQVAYSLDGNSYDREVGNLTRLARSFGDAERYVLVTYEGEQTISCGGIEIEVIPAYKFLLQ